MERGAADEVEVILAPLGAPIGMVEGGALHFRIIVSKVDDEFIGTWLKRLQHFLVRVEPLGFGYAGAELQDGVEDDGAGFEVHVEQVEITC